MKEEHVLQALAALAEDDREMQAPPEAEARLLGAFRARRRSGQRWLAITATAAALAITAALWWNNRAPQPTVSTVSTVSRVPDAARPAPAVAETMANVARVHRKTARKVAAANPPPQTHEVVTDFFPLMNPEPSFERGQMLRVQLPASAMLTVGLPVREEHLGDLVQADVLVGEEGIPRAIRFVRFDVK
jgi:hypothetical protein